MTVITARNTAIRAAPPDNPTGRARFLPLRERIPEAPAFLSFLKVLKQWLLQKVINRVRNDARKYWAYAHPAIMQEAYRRKAEKRYTLQ